MSGLYVRDPEVPTRGLQSSDVFALIDGVWRCHREKSPEFDGFEGHGGFFRVAHNRRQNSPSFLAPIVPKKSLHVDPTTRTTALSLIESPFLEFVRASGWVISTLHDAHHS